MKSPQVPVHTSPNWRTYAAVAGIVTFTVAAVAALVSAFPVYFARDQTCVIPGTDSPGAVVCDGKALASSGLQFSLVCPADSTCPPLVYSDGVRLTFNTSLAASLHLTYAANQTVAMSLSCRCGTNVSADQQSIHASYPVTGGTYTIILTNHNAGPVKLSWSVYVSRWGGPHGGFLSKYFGQPSP